MKKPSPLQAAEVMVVDAPTLTPAVCQSIVTKISQETDDAFYLFDVGDVIEKYKIWLEQLPRVKPYFAVKCNNHPMLLQVLNALGAGFDCASKAEIQTVLDMGVSPDRIIFANPCKPASHIRFANQRDVDLMTFDNEVELHKVHKLMPHARLVLRIRTDATTAQCPHGLKFGAEPTQTGRLLKLAAALQLSVVGVSFHVGSSGCGEPAAYGRAVRAARAVFDRAEQLGLPPMSVLDIGGGFGGGALAAAARHVTDALDECFPAGSGVQVVAEPGRYLAASAFMLATQVTSVRWRPDGVDYYINDGVYGSFSSALYSHQPCRPRALKEAGVGPLATVWGPTRDVTDRVCEAVPLPLLQPGAWLVWDQMGAYTLSAGGTLSSSPRADVHCVVTAPLCGLVRGAGKPLLTSQVYEPSAPMPAARRERERGADD